jgi:large subunit ribosomal protein L10
MANAKIIEKKKKLVENLKEKINSAKVVLISDYRGISVKQITDLRKKLRSDGTEYKVFKNTLIKRALSDAGFKGLEDVLEGPVALLFGYEDPVEPLKVLFDFIGEVEKGDVKAGIIEKQIMQREQIVEMSKLPSREELIAKMVGGFQSPIYGLVNVLQGNIRKLIYALNAVKDKKQ